MGFHQTVEKAADNQYLQFTAAILINDINLVPYSKKEKVQIRTNDEFPLLDMKWAVPLIGTYNLLHSGEMDRNLNILEREVPTYSTLCTIP